MSLYSLHSLFQLTHPLSQRLQKVSMDIVTSTTLIDNLIQSLENNREDCNAKFHSIFESAVAALEAENISVQVPRQARMQTNRDNTPHSTPEEYYLRCVFIPLIDNVLTDIKSRLTKKNLSIISLAFLMPVNIVKLTEDEMLLRVNSYCSRFSEIVTGQPFHKANEEIIASVSMWRLFCLSNQSNKYFSVESAACESLVLCERDIFPIIHDYLTILCTASISVASAERSFSVLRRLKSWIRSRMSQDRLNGLAVLAIHREILIEIDEVIDLYAEKSHRSDFSLKIINAKH